MIRPFLVALIASVIISVTFVRCGKDSSSSASALAAAMAKLGLSSCLTTSSSSSASLFKPTNVLQAMFQVVGLRWVLEAVGVKSHAADDPSALPSDLKPPKEMISALESAQSADPTTSASSFGNPLTTKSVSVGCFGQA